MIVDTPALMDGILLKRHRLPATTAKVVNYRDIVGDIPRMMDMLDRGISYNGKYAHGVAVHHAQIANPAFDFFVVDRLLQQFFNDRRVIINPKIVDQKYLIPFEEGCLSFLDREYVKTRRFEEITIEFYRVVMADGSLRKEVAYLKGFPAFMVQHEIDHGQGKHIHDGQFAEYNTRTELNKDK